MKKSFNKKYIILSLTLVAILAIFFFYNTYRKIYKPNILKSSYALYIPTNFEYTNVIEILEKDSVLKSVSSFKWLAEKKNYPNHIYAGKYMLDSSMSNNDLIGKLRSGFQDPVRVVFNSVRSREQLAGKISKQIEPDSISLLGLFLNDSVITGYGLKPETFTCVFLPNTYEFWWNTSGTKFITRMYKEYQRFWNDDRKQKAAVLNLTPEEVITLASIVDEETYYNSEMPVVAGLYINRLRKRMHLQADPTLKFALGDFTIKRVLNVHKQIDSPYNTYKRYGLPPGPISIPSISAIDAVLNFESHSYIYMCAKPDFSGYHNFAKTLTQHNVNANNYQRALNKERIWR
ncbi:MAG: endolytic transglycosylase MltG [Bacteroidales bacterium]|jgi:UPF0755 protein|nr:endolytic transglycosylase MltG [Bacteroidales bacterium]